MELLGRNELPRESVGELKTLLNERMIRAKNRESFDHARHLATLIRLLESYKQLS